MDFFTLLLFLILTAGLGFLLMAASLGFIGGSIAAPFIDRYIFTDQLIANPYYCSIMFLSGLFLILMGLRALQLVTVRTRRDKALIFKAQYGPIHITLFALQRMIQKTLSARPELKHIYPLVRAQNNELEIIIRTDIRAGVNVLNTTREMQNTIYTQLSKILGAEQPMHIKVEVRRIMVDKNAPSVEAATETNPVQRQE